ncbi:MAG: AAA family ATPase [Clostridiales bacterium]|jgi:type II secretory pathway predicted ATPase ExeA|nr:AAA family ATPase [Clostridiales bacterium]NMA24253.1 AAA family ATPase [Clostridiales bacterium]
MFEDFYGFSNTPFSRSIPTDMLYHGNDSDELIERLKYAATRQLFAVMTGDSGTGKTTTLRRFHDELRSSRYQVLYLSDSKMTPRLFYRALLEQLGCSAKYYRGEAKRQLHKEIEIMKGVHGLLPVVIVDEAHLLDRDMLEEIRFLLNFKMDSQSPMSLILSGQSELWERLKLQSFAAIRQRIDVQCGVGHMDRLQTAEYIKTHLNYAGCDKDIFSDAAVDDVFHFSSGISRLINRACTSSLIYGAQNRKNIIDDRMVKLVIECELT